MTKRQHNAVEFGLRVAALRDARGLSRKDLARALGMGSESAISEIENGRNQKGYEQLACMAYVLGTTPNILLGFEAETTPVDGLDMMGAAVQLMLIDEGWPRERAVAVVDIATEVALEKSELDLERRLAAAFRKRVLNKSP